MAEVIDDILMEAEDHMDKSVQATAQEFNQVRTGRATPGLIEQVMVDYHGTMTPLQQLAMIRAPEARLLTIEPWEKSLIHAIEKGIAAANLGMNPQNDGKIIRIAIPPLTEDRRKELAKGCQLQAEQGRIAIRNVRRDAIDQLRKIEKEGIISEDEMHRGSDEVQKLTDQYIKQLDKLLSTKQAELLED